MNVVVVGSSGQLARHLKDLLPQARFLSRADADLSDPAALHQALQAVRPSHIVNAAAYTAVDRAETECALAWSVNATAPAIMAATANTLGIPLVHVSTDYVFDGSGDRAWRIDDAVNPQNVYGRTKLAGELAVRTLCARHWILRTSWVFSEHGQNFVKTIIRLAGERPELRIVDDQRGCPTYAGDLARFIAALLGDARVDAAHRYGTHHVTGGPAVSWREFADTIVEIAHGAGLLARRIPVIGIRTLDYPTPAKRPSNSVLEPSALLNAPDAPRFDWRAGLEHVIGHLKQATG